MLAAELPHFAVAREGKLLLGSSEGICRRNTMKNIREDEQKSLTSYRVKPRLKHDIRSMFAPDEFVFRQEISRQGAIIAAVMFSGQLETPRISERSPQIFELRRYRIEDRSPWLHTEFFVDKVDRRRRIRQRISSYQPSK